MGSLVGAALENWTAVYSNHPALRTVVEFVHIGGLVAGGGCAITADLATLLAIGDRSTRGTDLRLLKHTHAIVLAGLVALGASGALLLAADADTYLHSRIFWTKVALMALLVVNGVLMLGGERQVRRGDPRAWSRLHGTAIASLVLWSLTTLAGAALPNIG
jgi:hypothetical protein